MESCRNAIGPHMLSPIGPELDGVTICGPAMGVTMGHVVGLDCCPVEVARRTLVSPRVSSHGIGIERQTKEHIDLCFF